MNLLKHLITPPRFTDATSAEVDETNRVAIAVHWLLLFTIIVFLFLLLYLTGVLIWVGDSGPNFNWLGDWIPDRAFNHPRMLSLIGVFLVIEITACAAFILLQRRQLKTARYLSLVILWCGMSYSALLNGGISSPEATSLILLVAPIGYLLGRLAGVVYAGLAFFSTIILYWMEKSGNLPSAGLPPDPDHLLLILLVNLALAAASIYIIMRHIQKALALARRQQLELSQRYQELKDIHATLEQRITERTEEINQQRMYFRALVQNSPVATVVLDLNHLITDCNPAFESLFGYSLSEIIGNDLDDFVATPEILKEAKKFTRAAKHGERVYATGSRHRKDGSMVEVEIYGVPVFVDEQQVGILGMYHDISERMRTQSALLASEERFRTLFEQADESIFLMDGEKVIDCNKKTLAVFRCQKEYVIGKSFSHFSPPILPDGSIPEKLGSEKVRLALDGQPQLFEWKYIRRDGSQFDAEISLSKVEYSEKAFLIALVRDISERKEVELRLQYLAAHDPLTGLPNRAVFFDRLEHTLSRAKRNESRIGVLFLDLDFFKKVNDTYGHAVGDIFLQKISGRMRNALRESDTVARMGGDEFAYILEDINSIENITTVVDKIVMSITQPVQVNEIQLTITTSVGVAIYPTHGSDAQTLVQKADQAMYHAKEEGKNKVVFYI